MIICHCRQPSLCSESLILFFGVGLIGGSIVSALLSRSHVTSDSLPFDWLSNLRREQDADRILGFVKNLLQQSPHLSRVDIVWAAGSGGFSSKTLELKPEFCAFETVLTLSQKLHELFPQKKACFHLISSAGGIFEGQRFVNSNSMPMPIRPYGELKLAEEEYLSKSLYGLYDLLIYRPSSVYGLSIIGNRKGLISTLLHCAERGQVAQIFGGQDTLRDFVYVEDIGRFVVDRLFDSAITNSTYMLVSGKSTAMIEVINFVEYIVNKKLYLQFWPVSSNALDNSYSQAVLPGGWSPIDIRTGIAKTYMQTKMYIN